MKLFSKILSVAAIAAIFVACDKKQALTNYTDGNAPQLTANTLNVAPPAADSNNTVLSFTWTDPRYSYNGNTKYTVEIDSVGKNFSNPLRRELMGQNTTSFIGKDLNNWMLSRGYAFNVPVSLEVRVVSSYANNNERIVSNVIPIRMTPYKIPPRVAVPVTDSLVITGAATGDGWANAHPAPVKQRFSKLDATTWAGIFMLNGGQEFLILPASGSWSTKYALQDNSLPGVASGGTFGFHGTTTPGGVFDANFKSPAATGLYRIELDFQAGTYSITPWNSAMLPDNLFITGAATGDGWANSATPPASQIFTRLNSSEYVATLPLTGGGEFLILPVAGSWSQKFAIQNNGATGISAAGELGYNPAPTGASFNDNFKAPATTGTRTIRINFAAKTTTAGAAGRYTIQ